VKKKTPEKNPFYIYSLYVAHGSGWLERKGKGRKNKSKGKKDEKGARRNLQLERNKYD